MFYQNYDFGISLSDIEDANDFSPVPPGEYTVQAHEVVLKNTKSGGGKYLQFEFVITDADFLHRKIFQNVIMEHSNEDAKRIGQQFLKSWIMACDGMGDERLTLSVVSQFLRKSCVAVLVVEEGKAGYRSKNKIQRFKKLAKRYSDEVPYF